MGSAAEFDVWHGVVAGSARCAGLFSRALGLPPDMAANGMLPWDGIEEVTAALRLAGGDLLADMACGRGGYGLEVARRTGARLAGVDLSAVAITLARQDDRGRRGWFAVGDFTAVPLAGGSADAVMCIDAIQFAGFPLDALREFRRVLAPGGRLAVTGWEPVRPGDDRLPARIGQMDLARDLGRAGFAEIAVAERPAWSRAERALWEAAVRADADGDRAVLALQDEAAQSLQFIDGKRRVLATAVAP